MQLIAGHLSIACRGALSPLDSVYKFAAKHWMSCEIPWSSLKCELRAYAGLLPLLKGDWTKRWCPEVSCSDASEKGWSFATRTALVSLVARHGRVLERSRCCGAAGSERALGARFPAIGSCGPGASRRIS